jgi:hypothetical protein
MMCTDIYIDTPCTDAPYTIHHPPYSPYILLAVHTIQEGAERDVHRLDGKCSTIAQAIEELHSVPGIGESTPCV